MSNNIYSDQIIVSTPLVYDESGYYHLIYRITNKKNGKIYIGKHSTKNPYDDYMGSGKRILRALKKYGIENFSKEILFCFTNEKEAFLKEEELVTEEFIDREDTYNMMLGGKGYQSGENHPMYGRRGEDSPVFGEKNGMYGKSPSQETKDKISKANKGKHVGEKNPMYGVHRYGEKNPMYGKKHNKETRDKISKANKGKPSPRKGVHLSQEIKDKISKSHIGIQAGAKNPMYDVHRYGENSPRATPILKLNESGNIVTEYATIKECCKCECIYYIKLIKLLKEHILYNGFYFEYKTKS